MVQISEHEWEEIQRRKKGVERLAQILHQCVTAYRDDVARGLPGSGERLVDRIEDLVRVLKDSQ